MPDLTETKVFCALDTVDLTQAVQWAAAVTRAGCGIKLGLEFFNANGPDGVKRVMESQPDAPLFLDLKFHDIPNTVAGAVRAACALRPAYMNVHAGGGLAMMQAARAAAREQAARLSIPAPRILAVTALTSLDDEALQQVGFAQGSRDTVLRLAKLTQQAGLSGIVCSAFEIEAVRAACGPDFALMVPGIRPADSKADDQKRVMTPERAISAGATHIVIGRPITGAANPAAAAQAIIGSLRAA